jgi:hypothetical protein
VVVIVAVVVVVHAVVVVVVFIAGVVGVAIGVVRFYFFGQRPQRWGHS